MRDTAETVFQGHIKYKRGRYMSSYLELTSKIHHNHVMALRWIKTQNFVMKLIIYSFFKQFHFDIGPVKNRKKVSENVRKDKTYIYQHM